MENQQLSDAQLDTWYEQSKFDYFELVGSEIRQLIDDLKRARKALNEPRS